MTIKLNRIELSNIRSHKHFVFTPESEGITAISGGNGAGKSTIVDSLAWALYGTKPDGVSKVAAIMNDSADFKQNKFFVRVELEIDNELLKIERRFVNKNGSVECEVWKKLPEGETSIDGSSWENVAGPSVSHAEPYIRQRFKMDENGFLSAVLVQQKQVDQLVKAGPRDRAEVIEKLTGISSITEALVQSRKELNLLKKTASNSDVDENELENLKKDETRLSHELNEAQKKFNSVGEHKEKLIIEGKKVSEEVERETLIEEKTIALSQEKVIIEATLPEKEKDFIRVNKSKNKQKEKLSLLSTSVTLESIEKTLHDSEKLLREHDVTIDRHEQKISDINEQSLKFEQKIKDSEFKTKSELNKNISNINKEITGLELTVKEKNDLIMTLKGNVNQIVKAVEVISSTDGNCPTCLQHVDEPNVVIPGLEKQEKETKKKIISVQKELKDIQKTLGDLQEKNALYGEIIEAIDSVKKLKNDHKNLETELRVIKGERTSLEKEIKIQSKIFNEAKRHAETKKEYDELLEEAKTISNEIEKMRGRLNIIDDEMKTLNGVTPKVLARKRKKLSELQQEYAKVNTEHIELKGNIALIQEKLNNVKEKIVRVENEVQKYKDLILSVELSTNATNVIEEFRENRIKNSIPIIEVYASDLLNRFTEGKFTRLKLDAKFNATVLLKNGKERAIGLLSGGELSAASMSLRLAISMLLNAGASKNLIVLDEVLVSQDSDRAEIILSTIKDVCKGQVILIAHNENIDAIADKVIEL